MQAYDEKLKLLGKKIFLTFYPYFFIVIGMILCISLINWTIYLHPQNFNFNQYKLYINTSVILSAIIVLLFRKRLISSVFNDINFRLKYFVVLVILIATPVYFSQIFLENLTTKVIHLNGISDISGKKPAKFFSVDNYKINQNELGVYFVA